MPRSSGNARPGAPGGVGRALRIRTGHQSRWAAGLGADDERRVQIHAREPIPDHRVQNPVHAQQPQRHRPVPIPARVQRPHHPSQVDPVRQHRPRLGVLGHGPRPELGHRLGQHVPTHRISHAVIGHAGADRAQAGHVPDHRPPLLPQRRQRHHLRPPRPGRDQAPRRRERLGVDRLRQRDRTGSAQRTLQRGPARGHPVNRRTALGLRARAPQPRQPIRHEGRDVRHLIQLVARQHRQRVIRLRHRQAPSGEVAGGLRARMAGVGRGRTGWPGGLDGRWAPSRGRRSPPPPCADPSGGRETRPPPSPGRSRTLSAATRRRHGRAR